MRAGSPRRVALTAPTHARPRPLARPPPAAHLQRYRGALATSCRWASGLPRIQGGRWGPSGPSGLGCRSRRFLPAQRGAGIRPCMLSGGPLLAPAWLNCPDGCPGTPSHAAQPLIPAAHLASGVSTTLAHLLPPGARLGAQVVQAVPLGGQDDHAGARGDKGPHGGSPHRGRQGAHAPDSALHLRTHQSRGTRTHSTGPLANEATTSRAVAEVRQPPPGPIAAAAAAPARQPTCMAILLIE